MPPPLSPYRRHVLKWQNCQACELCHGRSKVVLCRGSLPCDVLFVGEAPGVSENVIGQPFVGPAGHLQDGLIMEAMGQYGLRLAFTNLVGCIPLGDDGDKIKEPPKDAIKACAPRLRELVTMARPRVIVCVGKLSAEWVKRMDLGKPLVELVHPAAILRAPVSQQGLMYQRNRVALEDMIEDHFNT